jgi:hypothetical protein
VEPTSKERERKKERERERIASHNPYQGLIPHSPAPQELVLET